VRYVARKPTDLCWWYRLLRTSEIIEPATNDETAKIDKALFFVQPTLTPELEFIAGMFWSSGRQFFKMQNHKMGLALRGVQAGDMVCLLSGAPTPHVIRRVRERDDEVYRFVGDAYVDGMMHGEADTEDLEICDLVFV
jgi:hypothetical protein